MSAEIVSACVCRDCRDFIMDLWLPNDSDERDAKIVESCEGFAVVGDCDPVGSMRQKGCDLCKEKWSHVFDMTLLRY